MNAPGTDPGLALRDIDGGRGPALFAGDAGRLLLEGGFRTDIDAAATQALRPRARQRFLEWMGAA